MKIFLVDPFNQKSLLNNELYNSPFRYLYDHLKEHGTELSTYDQKQLISADKIIFFNHNKSLLAECEKLKIDKQKCELVLWEPETVIPGQYCPSVWSRYGKVVTLRDDLALKYNFPKINWPQGQTVRTTVPGFKARKLITLINANKFSYVRGELYSLRRDVICFFQKKNDGNFDLYGIGWGQNPFKKPKMLAYYALMAIKQMAIFTFLSDLISSFFISWSSFRGEVADKYKVLDDYKFNICIENEATYVTEKIFDSFSSGAIPVYKGPAEIKKLVPEDCYVDFDQFKTLEEMYLFLKSMTEEEYTQRQLKIIEYMNGDHFKKLQPKAVFYELSKILSQ